MTNNRASQYLDITSTLPQPIGNYASTSAQQPGMNSSWPTTKAAIDQEAKIRNAAAQARHRQKRKAHIAQMEKDLVQLQEKVKASNSDSRLRKLQQENDQLHRELQQLRAQWSATYGNDDGYSSSPIPISQQGNWTSFQGTSQSPNASYAISPPSGLSTSPQTAYFPPPVTTTRGSYQVPVRYNPVGERPTHRSEYTAPKYDAPGDELDNCDISSLSFGVRPISQDSNRLNSQGWYADQQA
ncbi:hypothetical protein FRB97_007694 [Tulasnella sp. 331]|nr:hypothetical protein FRB97_007694 [Tulasnella sp. 331]